MRQHGFAHGSGLQLILGDGGWNDAEGNETARPVARIHFWRKRKITLACTATTSTRHALVIYTASDCAGSCVSDPSERNGAIDMTKQEEAAGSVSDQLPTLLGSASAGMVGRIFCHPIDTVKARLQASTATGQSMRGLLQLQNMSLAHLRGLYRGLGVSMIGSAPATCLYLTSYEVSKDSLQPVAFFRENPSLLYLGAGMLAEALSCVMWVPIDVIKERMQVQVQVPVAPGSGATQRVYYRNTFHAVQTIMQTERLRGLYKGYAATLLSFGPFSALYFMFYEENKAIAQNYLKTEELPMTYTLPSAALAGAVASFITNPLDMIKLRLQVQRAYAAESSATAYTGITDGLVKVIRSEGVLALYKGAGARVAFHAPSTAITMSLFESCRHFFADLLDKQ